MRSFSGSASSAFATWRSNSRAATTFRCWLRAGRVSSRGRVTLMAFAPIFGANTIERQAKSHADQPSAKSFAVAQTMEIAIGAQHSFLCDVFGLRRIVQDAQRDAIG